MLDVSVPATALVIAASKGSTPAWVTTLIAGGAAIAAALVTALSAAYVARRKVAELYLTNSFELSKQYLESARNYTQGVYLPLSIEVYNLHDSFLTYKAVEKPTKRSELNEPWAPRDQFENDCELFIATARTLFRNGAGAVLTGRLDEDVTAFISFLRESLIVEEVVPTKSLLKTAGGALKTVGSAALTAA